MSKMQKKISLTKIFILILLISCTVTLGTFLGRESSAVMNFRTCQSPLKPSRFTPSLEGLSDLRCSASGRLSKAKIEKYFSQLPPHVYVVDVREERDYFYKGVSAGWLGLKITNGQIEDRLVNTPAWTDFLHQIKWFWRRLVSVGTWRTPTLAEFESEAQFLAAHGHQYLTFAGARHRVHSDEMIEEFIAFLDQLPPSAWLHFHCATGRGRSTTFMILFDIYKNFKKVSLDDIVLRQHLLGGENVFDVALRPKGTWTKEALMDRKDLVAAFYAYMRDPKGHGATKWTQWRKTHGLGKEDMKAS